MTNPFAKKASVAEAPPASPLERRPPAADRKPARPTPLTTDPAVSPFLADHTRGGLTDRFAELNRRRSDWVLVCIGLMACLLVSLGMNAYQAVRTHLIPFKVIVDGDDGYILDAGPLEPMTGVEDLYIRRDLREVITGLRTVTADRAATVAQFDRAWGRVVQGSDAQSYLADYYAEPGRNPMELVGRGQRTVVEFVGPTKLEGTDTWTFQWVERTASAETGVQQDTYRGSMTVELQPVENVEDAVKNPLGIWIKGLQWERVSSKILDLQDLEGGSPLNLLYPDQRGVTAPRVAPRDTVAAPGAAAPAAEAAPDASPPAPTSP